MEDNFRNVLIILSAIVIAAIFIHGLWTIRKQKNPYKLKTTKDKIEPITLDLDRKAFEQDGVGQVKIEVNTAEGKLNIDDEAVAEYILSADIQLADDLSKSQILIKKDVLGELTGQPSVDPTEKVEDNSSPNLDDWFEENETKANSAQFTKNELDDELVPTSEGAEAAIKPLYEHPVTQAKPARTPIKKVAKPATKSSLKRNQMEIDFDNQVSEEVVVSEKATEIKTAKTPLEPQVIILSVVMPANQQILGAALLPSLLTLGLKYGDMNIFHRHEDNAGNGKVTFSLANLMNPGSFDLDSMENFATRGVSLFMTLPNANDPLSVFEQMLSAAKQLAQEFNAQVLDDKRNVMTKQTEQHYVSKIREFDRKSHIARVE